MDNFLCLPAVARIAQAGKIILAVFLLIPTLAFAEDRTSVTLRINPYSREEENKKLKYTINAEYPQIANEKLTIPEKRINRAIRRIVKSDAKSFGTLFEGENPAVTPIEDTQSSLDTSYKYYLSGPNERFLSVIFEVSTYLSGAAHGITIVAPLTFDRHTGREVQLKHIFKKNTDYIEKLSNISRKALREQLGERADANWIDSGTEPKPENFEVFAFTDKGFTIFFQQYQVASFADGIQEVVVPYSDIEDMVNPRGPLGVLPKIKAALSTFEDIKEIDEITFELPSNIHKNQLNKFFQLGDVYFALVMIPSMNIQPELPKDFAPTFSGVLAASKGDMKWLRFLRIEGINERSMTNNPYYFWNKGAKMYLTVVDASGAGSGEGDMKVISSEDGFKWKLADCYYFQSYEWSDDYFAATRNFEKQKKEPLSRCRSRFKIKNELPGLFQINTPELQ